MGDDDPIEDIDPMTKTITHTTPQRGNIYLPPRVTGKAEAKRNGRGTYMLIWLRDLGSATR